MNNSKILLVVVASFLGEIDAQAQESTTLPVDAEHYGALFDRTLPITFYNSGRLFGGHLKSDYAVNGAIFEAGTSIRFFEDGRVRDGTLKTDTVINAITFLKGPIEFHAMGAVSRGIVAAGYSDANLIIPIKSTITLDTAGRVTGTSPVVNIPKFSLLGRSIRNGAQLYFDPLTGAYRILASTAAEPMIVARFSRRNNRFGAPVDILPVVVPVNTFFRLDTGHPALASIGQTYDRWTPPERFQFNGWDFGMNPVTLYVRDMRLIGVAVTQDVTVGGHTFPAHSVIQFDDNGRIIPPGELEQFP